ELPYPGHSLAVQYVVFGGRRQGVLMVAVPDDAAPEKTSLLWELLRNYSGWLTAWFALEAARAEAARSQQVMAELAELANLAALASPVTHEFNNFLNTVLLQLMVLSTQVPEQFRADLKTICQQGRAVAGLVRQWQQHRAQHRAGPRRLDVNALVCEVVAHLAQTTSERATPLYLEEGGAAAVGPPNGIAVRLSLADDLPPVEGNPLDFRLAVRFLVTNAAATITTRPGAVRVSTRADGNAVELSVEDTGPPIPAALLPRMFEPSAESREGASSLELAACEALVQRRLRGEIRAENSPAGTANPARSPPPPAPPSASACGRSDGRYFFYNGTRRKAARECRAARRRDILTPHRRNTWRPKPRRGRTARPRRKATSAASS